MTDKDRMELVVAAANRILTRLRSFCPTSSSADAIGTYNDSSLQNVIEVYTDRLEVWSPSVNTQRVRYDSVRDIIFPAKDRDRHADLLLVCSTLLETPVHVRLSFSWHAQTSDAFEFGRFMLAARRAWLRR